MSMEVVNSVGRRKAAVARVYVKPGKGNITINSKPLATYFPLEIFQYVVKQPLLVTDNTEKFRHHDQSGWRRNQGSGRSRPSRDRPCTLRNRCGDAADPQEERFHDARPARG